MTGRNTELTDISEINVGDTIEWESDFYRVDSVLTASDESDRVVLVFGDLVHIFDLNLDHEQYVKREIQR